MQTRQFMGRRDFKLTLPGKVPSMVEEASSLSQIKQGELTHQSASQESTHRHQQNTNQPRAQAALYTFGLDLRIGWPTLTLPSARQLETQKSYKFNLPHHS